MFVKFKCKSSGCIAQFEYEHDIEAMRKHPDYEELTVKEVEVKEEPVLVVKKAGRPKKEAIEGEDNGN